MANPAYDRGVTARARIGGNDIDDTNVRLDDWKKPRKYSLGVLDSSRMQSVYFMLCM